MTSLRRILLIRAILSLATAAVATIALGCSPSPGPLEEHRARQGSVHPVPASQILRFEAPAEQRGGLSLHPDWKPVLAGTTIGVLDFPDEQVLGAVQGVTHDQTGNVLILDAHARAVRSFDRRARAVETIGGYGSGPGEFLEPRSMVLAPDGRLLVGEARGVINVFHQESSSFQFSRYLRHEGDLWELCVLGDRLYVHGMTPVNGHTIHAYTMDGDLIDSFAQIYQTSNRIIRHQLSRGRIACADSVELILMAPAMLPELRAYSPAGDLLWWIEIADLAPPEVSATASGGSRITLPDGVWHTTVGVVASGEHGMAILQVAEVTTNHASQRSRRLHTFAISLDQARGQYMGDEWPRILHWSDNRLFAVREDPYPEVIILE